MVGIDQHQLNKLTLPITNTISVNNNLTQQTQRTTTKTKRLAQSQSHRRNTNKSKKQLTHKKHLTQQTIQTNNNKSHECIITTNDEHT